MKLVASSADLLRGILTVSKAIPAKTSVAILENYLFEVDGDKLFITASDMELTLKTQVAAQNGSEDGKVAVPSRQLTELLKEMPDQPIRISSINENMLECVWSTGESTLPYYNAEDYPVLRELTDDKTVISIDAKELVEGMNSTLYAASDDEARPIVNSIFFDIKGGALTMVATDLQVLLCYNTKEVKVSGDTSFVLNRRHAAALRTVIDKEDGEVRISFDDKIIVFEFAGTIAICSMVSGKYPDYTTIIPSNNANILKADRQEFLNCVKRVAVFSSQASKHLKLDIQRTALEISAQDLGFEVAAHDKLSCEYNGEEMNIGFKSGQLIDLLSNIPCERIEMKIADKRRAALVLPSEDEADASKVFGIVMPVMVK